MFKKLILSASLLACSVPAHAQLPAPKICEPMAQAPAPLNLGDAENLSIKTETDSYDFSVEIADTAAEQARGLMFRSELAPNAGMLFKFEQPRLSSIWMKNTFISLDLLFVRKNGEILKIVHEAEPCSLRSHSSEGIVGAVVEIPGGRARELGIVAGDIVEHSFFGNVTSEDENSVD